MDSCEHCSTGLGAAHETAKHLYVDLRSAFRDAQCSPSSRWRDCINKTQRNILESEEISHKILLLSTLADHIILQRQHPCCTGQTVCYREVFSLKSAQCTCVELQEGKHARYTFPATEPGPEPLLALQWCWLGETCTVQSPPARLKQLLLAQ